MDYGRLLLLCVPLLASCGGGGILSGFGGDDELCASFRGTWEGPTTSSEGKGNGEIFMFIGQDGDSCKVSGTVTFLPCVLATPLEGKVDAITLDIETIDSAFRLTMPVVDLSGIQAVLEEQKNAETLDPDPIGQTWTARYTFFNPNNVPNCPASDTGKAKLTKTG